MIDNIRFYLTFKPNEFWIDNLKDSFTLKDKYSKPGFYSGKLFLDQKKKRKENGKLRPYLFIEITQLEDNMVKLNVTNSLRKWYFNKETVGDFTKNEFNDCLDLLTQKLFISKKVLLEAKVTRVEYGSNLNLREELRCFYLCIHSHHDIKKKCSFGNETVEFRGENRSVIFYDKVAEQKGKTFLARNEKKMKKFLLLRYEIKVNKMSGSPEKSKMETLNKIIENWDDIVDLWRNELDKITFVNNMNGRTYDYLKDAKIKPIKEYLIYIGIESLGTEKLELILRDRMYAKLRSQTSKDLVRIYNDFKEKIEDEDFEFIFKSIVKNRAEILKG